MLGKISEKERRGQNNHKPGLVWITGLSASGKSTIAVELEHRLCLGRIRTFVLDGDNVRHGFNRDLGFTKEDRKENLRRAAEVARLFVDAGMLTIAAFISPYESDRLSARKMFAGDEFIEVYLKCDLSVCEMRDPKGLYKRARNGELKDFTGISAPYEPPENPEIVLETDILSVEESVDRIVSYLKAREIIPRNGCLIKLTSKGG